MGKLPDKWPCKCGAEMTLRRGRRAGGWWRYECAACGAGVSSSTIAPPPKRRGLIAAKSKPARRVKLLLPLLTDWTSTSRR